jgi:PadR family transcriptional regulator
MSHEILGGFQQLVMLAVLRLGDDAYGARVQQELEETAGRSVSISTVYVTLERLERKGHVSSWLADPTPVRGGRSKRYYALTPDGLAALNEARDALARMWAGVAPSGRSGPSS